LAEAKEELLNLLTYSGNDCLGMPILFFINEFEPVVPFAEVVKQFDFNDTTRYER
jgi:hypothetical protein